MSSKDLTKKSPAVDKRADAVHEDRRAGRVARTSKRAECWGPQWLGMRSSCLAALPFAREEYLVTDARPLESKYPILAIRNYLNF